MKKNLSLILICLAGILLSPNKVESQNIFKATSYYGSTTTSIIIVLQPNFNFNDKLNEVGFAIQVPKVIGGNPIAQPVITVLNNFLASTFNNWSQISEAASDPNFYNYKFGATALSSAPTINLAAGAELQVVELQIPIPVTGIPLVRLAHLADGGPGTQYGAAFIDGSIIDRTNYAQIFYGTGLTPATPAADETTGYSTYQYVLSTSTPVPVKFLGFNVSKKNSDAVLTWQIENETSMTDHYEVERSVNGVDFVKMTSIIPKNNGNSSNSYDFTDVNLFSTRSGGVIYYRIKQIDKDGKFIITPIRNLRLDSKSMAVSVYPNPIRDNVTISLDLVKDEKVTLTINDAAGKQVQNISYTLFKGLNIKKINMSGFSSGNYMLKVITGSELKTIPLVKAN